jgi:hypothetical protein
MVTNYLGKIKVGTIPAFIKTYQAHSGIVNLIINVIAKCVDQLSSALDATEKQALSRFGAVVYLELLYC